MCSSCMLGSATSLLLAISLTFSLPIVPLIHSASVPLASFLFLKSGRLLLGTLVSKTVAWSASLLSATIFLLRCQHIIESFSHHQHKIIPPILPSLFFIPLHRYTYTHVLFIYPTIFHFENFLKNHNNIIILKYNYIDLILLSIIQSIFKLFTCFNNVIYSC